jgi:hypothetical protein
VEVKEHVADLPPARGVADAEPVDVRVPGGRLLDPLEAEAEHLGAQAEEPVEDRLEGQVRPELVRVDGVVAAPEARVAVAPVPGPQGRLLAILAEDLSSDCLDAIQPCRGTGRREA